MMIIIDSFLVFSRHRRHRHHQAAGLKLLPKEPLSRKSQPGAFGMVCFPPDHAPLTPLKILVVAMAYVKKTLAEVHSISILVCHVELQ